MRSRVVVLVMLLVFAVAVGAQAEETRITPGVRAGINMAGHRGSDTGDHHKYRMGIVGGGFVRVAFHPRLALQTEILYSKKGYKYESDIWKEDARYNYIEVPILIRFLIPLEAPVTPNLFAGVAPAYLLGGEEKREYKGTHMALLADTQTYDVKDYSNSLDVGLVFGAGVDIELGSGMLLLDARYTMGMRKVYDVDFDWDAKNKAFTFMLGYGIKR